MNIVEAITAAKADKCSVFEAFINNEQILLMWDDVYKGIAVVAPERTAHARALSVDLYREDQILADWNLTDAKNPYSFKGIYDVCTGRLVVTNGEYDIELVSDLGESLEFHQITDEKDLTILKTLQIEMSFENRITLDGYNKFVRGW